MWSPVSPTSVQCVLGSVYISTPVMGSRRPLPIPPYPGIIPYTVDSPQEEDAVLDENSPRLLGMEERPISSFGLPAQSSLTEARDKFYQNWQKQQVFECYYFQKDTDICEKIICTR